MVKPFNESRIDVDVNSRLGNEAQVNLIIK